VLAIKYYVKRDGFNSFQKAMIELETTREVSAICMALDHYATFMEKHGFDNDEKLGELYRTIDAIRKKIDFKNELPWQ
jgi:hypothetical protein